MTQQSNLEFDPLTQIICSAQIVSVTPLLYDSTLILYIGIQTGKSRWLIRKVLPGLKFLNKKFCLVIPAICNSEILDAQTVNS